MKRVFLTVAAMLFVLSSYAQEPRDSKTQYYRHEVSFSRTGMILPLSQWKDYENKVYRALLWEHDSDGSRLFGPSSNGTLISYYYHLSHRVAFGGMMAFTTYDCSLSGQYMVPVQVSFYYWDNKEHILKESYRTEYESQYVSSGKIREKSFFLMPSLKWSWLNNSWCSLYMKASVGLHYQKQEAETGEIPLKSDGDLDENKLRLSYLATPFGWEIGKQKVRGFIELGFGSNTNFQLGLTYRFGRY